MRGRRPSEYRLRDSDRSALNHLLGNGRLAQRIAIRARALLALDRGERIGDIVHWLGLSRTTLWDPWQRYRRRGIAAIVDEERSGRPPTLSPPPTRRDRAAGLYRSRCVWLAPGPLGLPQPPTGGGPAGGRRLDPLHDHRSPLGGRQLATPPQPLLEDGHDRGPFRRRGRQGPLVLRASRLAVPTRGVGHLLG